MPYTPWAESRRNHILNPNFVGPTSWSTTRCSYATPEPGAAELTVTEVGYFPRITAAQVAVSPGQVLTVSARVGLEGTVHRIGMQTKLGGSGVANLSGQTSSSEGDIISLTVTIPASGVDNVQLWLGTEDNAPIGTKVRFLEPMLEFSDKVNDWFAGDSQVVGRTERTLWSGTANNSASILESRAYLMPSLPPRRRPGQPQDYLVEIRDKNLVRRGAIPVNDLNLTVQPVFNGVGSWSLSLPEGHRAVPMLRTPGWGVLITNIDTGEIVMSGNASKPVKNASSSEPEGVVTISGLSDDRLAFDARALPNPANGDPSAPTTQSHDIRTGSGESIMRQYLAHNIAWTHAPVERVKGLRSFLQLQAVNKQLGNTITKRARFDNLGELLNEIAIESGGLGWRIVQRDLRLIFEVFQPVDRRADIRLDIANGTLAEQSVEFAPPEVTRVIGAGGGEGTKRVVRQVTTPESVAAEDAWGLVIEDFKDQRQTVVIAEIEAAALGELEERGFTKVAVKGVPSQDQSMVFLRDFGMGDRVTMVIDNQETSSQITEAVILINKDGVQTGIAVGDVADFDSASALRQTVTDTQRRVSNLERNSESGSKTPWSNMETSKIPESFLPDRFSSGVLVSDWNEISQPGFYYGPAGTPNAPSSGDGWAAIVRPAAGGRMIAEASNPTTTTRNMKITKRRVWNGSSWSVWITTDRHDLPATTPVATAPFGMYGGHAGGTPQGSPFAQISGGFASIRVFVRNDGTAAQSIAGGAQIGAGFPPTQGGDFPLPVFGTLTSSPGAIHPSIGGWMDNQGRLYVRAASYSVAVGELFQIAGVYPTVVP